MLAPYAGDHPPPTPPWVTLALVGLNAGVFAVVAATTLIAGPDLPVRWFAALGLLPEAPRWYAFLSYSLLHEHLFHLSANMLVLWVFGGSSEHSFGRLRLLGLYISAGVVAGSVELLIARQSSPDAELAMIIGASGAAAAMVGAFTAAHHRARVHVLGTRWSVPAVAVLACVAAAEVAALATGAGSMDGPGGVDPAHWAHIAGFVYGMGWAHVSGAVRNAARQYAAHDAETEAANGTPIGAASRWETLLRRDPDNEQAIRGLIDALLAAGERDRAATHLLDSALRALSRNDRARASRLLASFPSLAGAMTADPSRMLSLAALLEEAGHAGMAAEMLRPLAESDGTPEAGAAAVRLAGCLLLLGRREDAMAELVRSEQMGLSDAWRRRADQLRAACREGSTASESRPPASTE